MYVCVHVPVCVSVCTHVRMNKCVCAYVCTRMCLYLCLCVCMRVGGTVVFVLTDKHKGNRECQAYKVVPSREGMQ